jgi:uncharacterized protein YrrD
VFTSKDQLDKLLVSVTDGKKLGEIKDLYLDQDMRQIAAVFLGKEGLVNRRSLLVPRSAVQLFGVDAWLISGSDKVVDEEDSPEAGTFTLVGDLRGREIQSEGGTKVGVIEDVVFDDQGGVLGFSLGKVYMQGPLSERKAVARGAITSLGSKNKPMIAGLEEAEANALTAA